MPEVRRFPALPAGVEFRQSFMRHFAEGGVATNGVKYTPVATISTTAVAVATFRVDPGVPLKLDELEIGFTQSFTELTDAVGSLDYWWRARENYTAYGTTYTGSWINLTGTYTKGIGSLATSEDTFSGYVGLGTIGKAPVDIELWAQSAGANQFTGKVKNSSYIRMIGTVIPGTA